MNKRLLLIILGIVFLSITTHWIWFFNLSIITNGDWSFIYRETMLNFVYYPSVWDSHTSFGNLALMPTFFPIRYTMGLISIFGLNFSLIERFIFLWPIVLISAISIFFLVKKITKSSLAGFISFLVYSFNPYFLIIKTGHLTVGVAYSLAPLVFLSFIISLEKKSHFHMMLSILSLSLLGFYEFRIAYLVFFLLVIYALVYSIILKKYLFNFKILLYLTLTFILLNLFWILNFIFNKGIAGSIFLNRGLFGNQYLNILESITNFHPFWTGSSPSIFIVQTIPLYLWIVPIIAFFSLLFVYHEKDNKLKINILIFSIVGLIGIFLTKQVDSPFTSTYEWLFNNFPGFNAFREASKFYLLINLGYSVLIGYTALKSYEYIKEKSKYISFLFIFIIVCLFIYNARPLITRELGSTFIPREIPQDYLIIKDKILSENDYYRTLWTPRDSRWGIYTTMHPKISNIDIIQTNWKEFTNETPINYNWPINDRIFSVYNKSYSDSLLDVSSIKYAIVPLRDTANDDDFFIHYGNSTEFYIDLLNNLSYLKEIDIGTKEVKIYENKGYLQNIYGSNINQSLNDLKKSELFDLQYESINPTKYKIVFTSEEPFYLYFSEAYHQQWKIASGNFKWYKGFFDNVYIFDSSHEKAYGFLNSWYINPAELDKNSDGEYELIIYFKHQSYFYLGLTISILTFICCIFYLFYAWKKDRRNKLFNNTYNY